MTYSSVTFQITDGLCNVLKLNESSKNRFVYFSHSFIHLGYYGYTKDIGTVSIVLLPSRRRCSRASPFHRSPSLLPSLHLWPPPFFDVVVVKQKKSNLKLEEEEAYFIFSLFSLCNPVLFLRLNYSRLTMMCIVNNCCKKLALSSSTRWSNVFTVVDGSLQTNRGY